MTTAPDAPTPERITHELNQGKEELGAAQDSLQRGYLNGAVSSAYYACFHAARALLYHYGSMPATHKGVMSEFSRLFVKTGDLAKEWSDILEEQRVERQLADYHAYSRSLTTEEATQLVVNAGRFVAKMEDLLAKKK